jgi:hypothetical protein
MSPSKLAIKGIRPSLKNGQIDFSRNTMRKEAGISRMGD